MQNIANSVLNPPPPPQMGSGGNNTAFNSVAVGAILFYLAKTHTTLDSVTIAILILLLIFVLQKYYPNTF